jgi:Ser-tRNA(Ala) deacylase AlaX
MKTVCEFTEDDLKWVAPFCRFGGYIHSENEIHSKVMNGHEKYEFSSVTVYGKDWKTGGLLDESNSNYSQRDTILFVNITPALWEQMERACQTADSMNKEVQKRRRSLLTTLHTIAEVLCGTTSKEYKYVSKISGNTYPPNDYTRYFKEYKDRAEYYQRVVALKIKQQEDLRKRYSETYTKAVEFLQSHDALPVSDREDTIQRANDLAAKLEIKRLEEAGGFFSFNGQNCENECAGWDGVSRRCECGNRRVFWVIGDGHSFESPYVYAEAY